MIRKILLIIGLGSFLFSNAQKDTIPLSLKEVVVSANRVTQNLNKVSSTVFTLSPKDIKKKVVYSADDALSNMMGISVFRPIGIFGTAKVSLRGISGMEQARILVLQDGVPINGSDLGTVNWNRINPLSLSKIEIIKGANSSSYGSNAMGGIINIITEKQDTNVLKGTVNLDYGTFNTMAVNSNFYGGLSKKKKLFYDITFMARKSDGYINWPDSLIDSTKIASFLKEYNLKTDLYYKLSANQRISISYQYYDDKRGQGIKIKHPIGNAVDHDTHFFRLKYSGKKARFIWNISSYYQNEHYFRIVEKQSLKKGKYYYTLYNVNSKREDMGVLANLSCRFKKHLFSFATMYKNGRVEGADEYVTSTDVVRNKGTIGNLSYSLFDNWSFTKKMSLNFSWHQTFVFVDKLNFLVENPSKNSDVLLAYQSDTSGISWNSFSPKIAFLYSYKKANTYFVFSTGYRVPTLDDLTRTGFIAGAFKLANPDLKPEKLMNLEWGIRWNPKQWSLQFSTYYSLGKDFMYYVNTGEKLWGKKPIKKKQNVTSVNLWGVETAFRFSIQKNLKIFTNYSWHYTNISEFEEIPELEGKRLTYSPEHIADFGVLFYCKYFDFSPSLRDKSVQYLDDENKKQIPNLFLLNIKFSHLFDNGFYLALSVNNLLNQRYWIYEDQLSIGRFMMGTIAYRF